MGAPGRRLSARCTAQRCDCDPPAQRGHEWREYEAGTELCVREGRRGWPVCMWIGRAVNRSNPCMCASRVGTVSCFPESVPMRVRFFPSEVGVRFLFLKFGVGGLFLKKKKKKKKK